MRRPQNSGFCQIRSAMTRITRRTSQIIGHPFSFFLACIAVLGWACSGPLFHYSAGWQLVINTGTTIFMFLMFFILQGSQNRDLQALQLKLDELITRLPGPRNQIAGIEKTEADLDGK